MTATLRQTTRHDAKTFTCRGKVTTAPEWDTSLVGSTTNLFRVIREESGWQVDRSGGLPWETAIRVSPEGDLTFSECGNRAKAAVFGSSSPYGPKAKTPLRMLPMLPPSVWTRP